jgi:hypothetical protein
MAKKPDKESAKFVEKVGEWEFTLCAGEPTPESRARWENRADAIAAWLMAEWKREQAARAQQAKDAPEGPSSP